MRAARARFAAGLARLPGLRGAERRRPQPGALPVRGRRDDATACSRASRRAARRGWAGRAGTAARRSGSRSRTGGRRRPTSSAPSRRSRRLSSPSNLFAWHRGIRVLRHESELGSWELFRRAPRPTASRWLRRPSTRATSRAARRPFCASRSPTTRLPLIVNFGCRWGIGGARGAARAPTTASSRGSVERSSYVVRTGAASCVQVNLTPLGAHVLLGLPMHEIANRVVTLDDVLPQRARHLLERLAGCAELGAAVRAPRRGLRRATRRGAKRRPGRRLGVERCSSARTAGRRSGGSATGSAGAVGISPRGSASRSGSRRRRSRGSCASSAPSPSSARPDAALAGVAFECGYFDQAHLNRDFREFAGTSSAAFARQIVPDGGVVPSRSHSSKTALHRSVLRSEHHDEEDAMNCIAFMTYDDASAQRSTGSSRRSASSARPCTRGRTADRARRAALRRRDDHARPRRRQRLRAEDGP